MPLTPFHFGLGAALHGALPQRVGFVAFCGANVLIDVEALYHLIQGGWPIHALFHSYLGATLVALATSAMLLAYAWLTRPYRHAIEQLLGPRSTRKTLAGAFLGAYSHVALDSIMHDDIRPLAPFSDANDLLDLIPLLDLHFLLVALGLMGLIVTGFRRLHAEQDRDLRESR